MTPTLALVDDLQRRATNEVAFYPRVAIERAIDKGEIELELDNGQPCGYLWHGPVRPGRDAVIYQAVIDYDARRRRHGSALVAALEDEARAAGSTGIRLRCRSELEANAFWQEVGFRCIAIEPSGIRRNSEVNTWRRPIQVGLFDRLVLTPSTAPQERSAYLRLGATRNRWNRHR